MENVCRTCLRVPTDLISIYADPNLIAKIETIASIKILKGNGYPENICQECIKHVNTLFNFRKVIRNNDRELKETIPALQRLQDKKNPAENPNFAQTLEQVISKSSSCKCNTCTKTFSSRVELIQHRKKEHMRKGVCNICGMMIRADNLSRHLTMHIAQPVTCPECGKSYKNPESLRSHMLFHRGDIFTCEICGRTSKIKSEHRRHLLSHTNPDINRYKCKLCGKKVRDMRTHMNSHTGLRPHVCSYCTKGFTSSYSLKVHIRQHTNEKPFNCQFCSMAFPQKVSLVSHMRSKHDLCISK